MAISNDVLSNEGDLDQVSGGLPGVGGVPIPPPATPPTPPSYVQPSPTRPPPKPPSKLPVWVVPTKGGVIIKGRGKHDIGGR